MESRYALFVLLFLTSLGIRMLYEFLKEAHKVEPDNKPVVAIVFAAMCILWISWFSLCPLDPLPFDLPAVVRFSGLALFVAGLVLAFGALISLRGVEHIDHLVTTGIFSRLRHPMYTGFILWIFGWAFYHGAILSFIVGLPLMANIFFWRKLEESRLLIQFGEAYQQYRQASWF